MCQPGIIVDPGADAFGYAGSPGRRPRRHPSTPSTPTALPIASDAEISKACTQRKPVGLPAPTTPPSQERGSFQIATANRGQIAQVQIPTAIKKSAQPRDSTMAGQYASGQVAVGLRPPVVSRVGYRRFTLRLPRRAVTVASGCVADVTAPVAGTGANRRRQRA
jgi:hypothetical protein